LTTWFGWRLPGESSDELPDIFPIDIARADFIKTDVVNIYAKILTDVIDRVHGIPEDQFDLLWDNCVKSSSSDGLITMISKAMAEKKDLFLVYEKALKVIRPATATEMGQIKRDYETTGESELGVFISFKNYVRSDMVRIYSGLEYCAVSALNKSMNLSKALQFKMSDLRGSTGVIDSADVKRQAQAIAKALGEGKDVLLDKNDMIETAVVDLNATKEAISFLDSKRSFYLGMPRSYIDGVLSGGLGSTGEGDTKAIERGLKNYYSSVLKPVLNALFGIKVSYKSQDFRQIDQALEALKTFELVGDELLSADEKRTVIASLLDLESE
jgi:hypothetical protein